MVVVNLKNVSTGFEVVPEGTYRVRLTNHQITTSKQGQPAFKAIVTIIDPQDYAGKTLPANGSLQSHALFGFKRLIAAFGAPEDVLEHESVNTDLVLRELRGNEADIEVTVGEYNGRPNNQLWFYIPGELETMADMHSEATSAAPNGWTDKPVETPAV